MLLKLIGLLVPSAVFLVLETSTHAQADPSVECPASHEQLVQALQKSVKPAGGPTNGGFDNNEWAAVVNRGGALCAIAYSGGKCDDQWPGTVLLPPRRPTQQTP